MAKFGAGTAGAAQGALMVFQNLIEQKQQQAQQKRENERYILQLAMTNPALAKNLFRLPDAFQNYASEIQAQEDQKALLEREKMIYDANPLAYTGPIQELRQASENQAMQHREDISMKNREFVAKRYDKFLDYSGYPKKATSALDRSKIKLNEQRIQNMSGSGSVVGLGTPETVTMNSMGDVTQTWSPGGTRAENLADIKHAQGVAEKTREEAEKDYSAQGVNAITNVEKELLKRIDSRMYLDNPEMALGEFMDIVNQIPNPTVDILKARDDAAARIQKRVDTQSERRTNAISLWKRDRDKNLADINKKRERGGEPPLTPKEAIEENKKLWSTWGDLNKDQRKYFPPKQTKATEISNIVNEILTEYPKATTEQIVAFLRSKGYAQSEIEALFVQTTTEDINRPMNMPKIK